MSRMSNSNDDFISISQPELIDCLTLGTGRFLRSVLIPALTTQCGFKTALFQTRGRSFLEHCRENRKDEDELSYEVDTVAFDGTIHTDTIICHGAGTLGSEGGKDALWKLLERMTTIRVIGIGVTEAGIHPHSPSLTDLTLILRKIHTLLSLQKLTCPNPHGRLCIVNTDNVSHNGNVIKSHVLDIASSSDEEDNDAFISFLKTNVSFLNSMVDRITSHRENAPLVPRCEPVPHKALVIEDLNGDLPPAFLEKSPFGVVVRSGTTQLSADIALKLRVANGTHTAVSHAAALIGMASTDVLSTARGSTLLSYVDAFFGGDVARGAEETLGRKETLDVYEDWRARLCHASFGLSTFFITQNGAAKGGIRLAPTVRSLILEDKDVSVTTAFALAAILRFLTPSSDGIEDTINNTYHGWLDVPSLPPSPSSSSAVTYADNLSYNLSTHRYDFKCTCRINDKPLPILLADVVHGEEGAPQPICYQSVFMSYLTCSDGGNMADLYENKRTKEKLMALGGAISTLLARMIANDGILTILDEIKAKKGVYTDGFDTPCHVLIDGSITNDTSDAALHYRPCPIPPSSHLYDTPLSPSILSSLVTAEVSYAKVIDLHTHLLPPSHGPLSLYGIDDLLTYHYLVAEYFQTAPREVTPEGFYESSKQRQAEMIWEGLFLERMPVSEAARGVVTTLRRLGVGREVLRRKDLNEVRRYYNNRLAGTDDDAIPTEEAASRFSEDIFSIAGVEYAIMTNIPFDSAEARCWRPRKIDYSSRYKSALRVDPLLAGDDATIKRALAGAGYESTLEGARQYLRDWCDTMTPEYMMASTPHDFRLKGEDGGTLAGATKKGGYDERRMKEPFGFVSAVNPPTGTSCDDETSHETPTLINEDSDYIAHVLVPVCIERDLPLALKIGAKRGVNPALRAAGDGTTTMDPAILARLCTRFPRVRFLATFLSRNSQHDACVLASKFRNLHLYGCWWFCNSASIIEEITKMRLEMLGAGGFTAQHSDARVLEQLVYKWSHSRRVVAKVLGGEVGKLMGEGWEVTRGEVKRDVGRLFGGNYEEFMKKSLL